MKKTYLAITITYYSGRYLKPEVHYYYNDGVNPAISLWDNMTVDEANKYMWELVKKGAKNSYHSNIINNAISERRVMYWGWL